MLLQAYDALSAKLGAITQIKLIDWFNDQYSNGIIHITPAVFVEFPVPMRFKTNREQFQQSDFTVRIHLANVAIADASKRIQRSVLAEHETVVQEIYRALHGCWAMLTPELKLFDSLDRTAYQHHQYMQGFLVTTQDFQSRIYQHAEAVAGVTIDELGITVN